jgi:hypothetical protein
VQFSSLYAASFSNPLSGPFSLEIVIHVLNFFPECDFSMIELCDIHGNQNPFSASAAKRLSTSSIANDGCPLI